MLISFLANVSFYMVSTTLSVYSIGLGATQALAGVIVGCFSITALIARPFSGAVVNRAKNVSMMALSLAGMGLASLGYAFFQNPSYFVFVRILHGIFFCINGTVTMVIVAKIVPKSRLSQGVAYFGLAQVFATAVGPNVSTIVGQFFSYRISFLLTAVILLVCAVLSLILLREKADTAQAPAPAEQKKFSLLELIDVKLLRLVIFSGLFSAFNGLNSSFILHIGQVRGIASIAMFFTVNSVSVIIIRLFLGKLADRVRSFTLILVPALASAVVGTIMIGSSNALIWFLIAAVIQAFGQGMVQPSVQAECLKRADPSRMGTASGTYYLSSDVGQGIGVMLGGYISQLWGYSVMYYVLAGCFAVAIPLFLLLNRNRK